MIAPEGALKAIKMKRSDRELLGADLIDKIRRSRSAMKGLLSKLKDWHAFYESDLPTKTFPWPDCSNVNVPITQWHVDTFQSHISDVVVGVAPYTLIKALPGSSYEAADAPVCVENFVQNVERNLMGLQRIVKSVLTQALLDGTAIGKLVWREEYRKMRVMQTLFNEETEEVESVLESLDVPKYIGPKLELVDLRNFTIYPLTVKDIDDAVLVGDRYRLLPNQVEERIKRGYFDKDYASKFVESPDNEVGTSQDTEDEETNAQLGIERLEQGYVYFWEVITGYDADGDGIDEDVVVTLEAETGTIVRIREYPYYHGKRWYVPFRPHPRPVGFFGRSVAQIVEHMQREINTIHNQRCVTVGTRILTDDLRWVKAEDLKVGDTVIGCDEENARNGNRGGPLRNLRRSTVEATGISPADCVEVVTDRVTVRATCDHPFLVRNRNHGLVWTEAKDLVEGDEIKFIAQTWTEDENDSWLSGMTDGEGSLTAESGKGGMRITVATQSKKTSNDGIIDRVVKVLEDRNFVVHRYDSKSGYGTSHPTECVQVCGIAESFRYLGRLRPMRLLKKWQTYLDKGIGTPKNSLATVVSVREVGLADVVNLQTSTHTYITEGLVSHNTDATNQALAKGSKILDTSDIDVDSLQRSPGAVVKVGSMDEIEDWEVSPLVPGMDIEQIDRDYAERADAITDLTTGRETQGEKTAREVAIVSSESGIRFGDVIENVQFAMVEIAQQVALLCYQFMSDEQLNLYSGATQGGRPIRRDELIGEYQYLPHGNTSTANKVQQREEAVFLYERLAANPLVGNNPKRFYRVTRDLLVAFDRDDYESYIGTEQEIEQMMQQMQAGQRAQQEASANVERRLGGQVGGMGGPTGGMGAGNELAGVAAGGMPK